MHASERSAAPIKSVSHYLNAPIRTLYTVCHELGRDEGGAACSACSVKTICDRERHPSELHAQQA
jgi:hypothetical protein